MKCNQIIMYVGTECEGPKAPADHVHFKLPELYGPIHGVHQLAIELNRYERVCISTRFPVFVNFVGIMIAEGLIDHKSVVVIRCEQGQQFSYVFDKDGIMREPWPFGCMEPDFDEETRNLK